jgi:hypothetical protein
MATLMDARFDALRTQLFVGATPDMMLQWLQANGATSNSGSDAWKEMLVSKGFGAGVPLFQETSPQTFTGLLGTSSANAGWGTQMVGSDVGRPSWYGLAIAALASFGPNFGNVRLGALGNEQIPGCTVVNMEIPHLGTNFPLTWNAPQLRYQGNYSYSGIHGADFQTAVNQMVTDAVNYNVILTSVGVSPPLVAEELDTYQRNQAWYDLLGSLGHTGSMNDRELQFWEAGGTFP